jgi:hypothetical protein
VSRDFFPRLRAEIMKKKAQGDKEKEKVDGTTKSYGHGNGSREPILSWLSFHTLVTLDASFIYHACLPFSVHLLIVAAWTITENGALA